MADVAGTTSGIDPNAHQNRNQFGHSGFHDRHQLAATAHHSLPP